MSNDNKYPLTIFDLEEGKEYNSKGVCHTDVYTRVGSKIFCTNNKGEEIEMRGFNPSIDRFKEIKPKKTVTFYRHFYITTTRKYCCSGWISESWGTYKSRNSKLIHTTTREFEIEE